MKVSSGEIHRSTNGNNHILDVTDELRALVEKSGIKTGQATAMVVGSTAALSTIEFEAGLVNHDVARALDRLAPEDGGYLHEETWHDDNGHSHVRATVVGPSLSLPIVEGKIPLGTWQQVVLLDFDTHPRERRIVVTIVGE